MAIFDLLAIAAGVAADAFAAAVGIGLTGRRAARGTALLTGLYFSAFHVVMTLAGYLLGTQFSAYIVKFGAWTACILLTLTGGKKLADSLRKPAAAGETAFRPSKLLSLAAATSIDALAAGVSLACLRASIVPALLLIGAMTLLLSMAGVKIGGAFGVKLRAKAACAGGVILILAGVKALIV